MKLTFYNCINTRISNRDFIHQAWENYARITENRDSIISIRINLNAGRGLILARVGKKEISLNAFSIAESWSMVRSTWRWRFDGQRYRPTPKCTLAPPRREPHRITSPTPPLLTYPRHRHPCIPSCPLFPSKFTVLGNKHDADWRHA